MGYAVHTDSIVQSLVWMAQGVEGPRPAMKLNVINLNDEVRQFLKEKEEGKLIPNTFGIIMNFLKEDSYGTLQGLKNLDVIVAIDGYPINDMRDMAAYMLTKKPYDTIYLMIIRNGEFQILPYKLDKLEIPMEYYDRDNGSVIPPSTEDEESEELE